MKKIYIILPLLLLFVLGACSPEEYDRLDPNATPQVSGLDDAIEITVDQETNTATFTLNKPGYNPVWIFEDGKYSAENAFQKVFPKAGDYTVEMKVSNRNGMSDGSITKTFRIEKSLMTGFGGFVYDSPFNMWKTAAVDVPVFWYATPDWQQIDDPVYTLSGSAYTVTLPSATVNTWQAQMAIETNISANAATSYDFSVILTSTKDHPHVMVKLTDASDDGSFFVEKTIALVADQPTCFWMSDMPGIDMASLKLVLDFGGNAAGTVMTIEDIVFKDHANDDGTEVPEVETEPEPSWSDVDSDDNLWKGVAFTPWFYYAPDWSQLPDPVLTINGTQYSVSFPSETFGQWQSQVHLKTESLATSAAEHYDFRVVLNASNDVKGATVKFAQDDNDEVFLLEKRIDLIAGEDVVAKAINAAGVDITKAKLVFDFGGNPASTDIVIKDIILQKHK